MTPIRACFACAALSLLPAVTCVQGQERPGATHPVVHIEILGADSQRLQRFYGELFGWKVSLNPVGYGYVPVAPSHPVTLTGGIGASPQGRPLAVFYVKVENPAAVLKKVASLGGRVLVPPVEVPGGITFAHFADPEGNVIGIVRREN
jgi:predicted enzyme related to lactoylglutathione lyase